jgi:hypothetical protein
MPDISLYNSGGPMMSATHTNLAAAPQRNPAITTASILYLVSGLGTLVVNMPVIAFMTENRTFPVVLGIPLMGSSFAERLGMDFMIRASIVFQIVNALDALVGYWLWKSEKRGGRLGIIMVAVGLPFWILFELPFFLLAGPIRLIALAAGWKSLR